MNIENVRTFLKVIETGKLNKAANALYVTQSTVTARIQSLESELGQPLLIRSKSGTELTAAGFKFKRYAEVLLQTWNQVRHELALPKGFDTVCHIGCHAELWVGLGDAFADYLASTCPQVALSILSGDQSELANWINAGRIEVALMLEPTNTRGWVVEKLFDDKLVEVSTVERELVEWDPQYIFVDHGSDYRRQHAFNYPVDETPSVVFNNSSWALSHLIKKGGSAYLPLRLIDEKIAAGELHLIEAAPVFPRPVYIGFNSVTTASWSWFNPAVSELASLVR